MPQVLEKRWLATTRLACRVLAIDEKGVSLGKTLLAPFREGRLAVDEARIGALLSVAYGHDVRFSTESLRHAERCYKSGDLAMAQMHLALCGLQAVDLEKAQRLFVAEWALDNHVSPGHLLKIAGIEKFNPNHLGPGPGGGHFTEAGRNGTSNGLAPGAGKPERRSLAVPPWVGSNEVQVAGPTRDAIAALMEQAEMQRQQTEAEQKAASEAAASQETDVSAQSISSMASESAAVAGTIAASESAAADMPDYMKGAKSDPSQGEASSSENLDWKLGQFKSVQRWQNQMQDRGWTSEDISDTIKNGEQFPANNNVNKGNSAIRYKNPKTGKSVVRDEVTKEVIHVGDDTFNY